MKRFRYLIILGLCSIGLAACTGQVVGPAGNAAEFRPPSLLPTQAPTQASEPETAPISQDEDLKPTPTPACSNSLWFLADITIPDGSVVQPAQRLDKRWQVQNNGTCNWDETYQVRLIAGPGMGVPVQQALVPALSGTETSIRMVFIAPQEPGNYRSAWQAYDPQEQPFGDPFFIDIVVEGTADVGTGE